jgi:flagellar biosynthesis anti-sigma factor FlgM
MRIDSNPSTQALPDSPRLSNLVPSAGHASTPAATSGVSDLGSGRGEDQAQLSGIHVQAQSLVAQAAQLPETSESKVATLRQSILGGSYQATPENVAGALFESLVANRAA